METRRPRLILGDFPTRLERLEALDLWIKRDDRAAALYGGNKVRKLERLLAEARAAGKARIVTIGAAGSHQVVATAVFGRREGFEVEAVLVPQASSVRARRNLRAALANGLAPVIAQSWAAGPALVATRLGRDTYFIPLGGSNVLGSIAFVDAATELAQQVSEGTMPEPDVIVVAMGSGGTAAGLAVGLELAQMRTRVVGVAVSQPAALLGAMARRLAKKTADELGLSRAQSVRAVQRIEIDRRWIGRGYALPTPAGDAATESAASAGVELDATYTAKAFAGALAARARGGPVLYWHTLSTAPLEPLLENAGELRPDLSVLFR